MQERTHNEGSAPRMEENPTMGDPTMGDPTMGDNPTMGETRRWANPTMGENPTMGDPDDGRPDDG